MTESRKRLKLSSEDRVDEKLYQNHPTLYFDDGNVILRTEWTLFCVHKSLLSKHSPVFRDLLGTSNTLFRGLALYDMEDSREDMETLLSLMYDGLRVDVQELTVESFPALATILRMAIRYKIERLCQDIIAKVRAKWPATLLEHDTQESSNRARVAATSSQPQTYEREAPIPNPSNVASAHEGSFAQNAPWSASAQPNTTQLGPSPSATQVHEGRVILAARVLGLLGECGYSDGALLFPLFYALSRTTWQLGGTMLGHALTPLTRKDMERLVVGIERLRAYHTALAVSVPSFEPVLTSIAGAPGPPHFCTEGLQQLWSSIALTLLCSPASRMRAHEPLEEWWDLIPIVLSEHTKYAICAKCAHAIVAKIQCYRQRLWAAIPGYFELD